MLFGVPAVEEKQVETFADDANVSTIHIRITIPIWMT